MAASGDGCGALARRGHDGTRRGLPGRARRRGVAVGAGAWLVILPFWADYKARQRQSGDTNLPRWIASEIRGPEGSPAQLLIHTRAPICFIKVSESQPGRPEFSAIGPDGGAVEAPDARREPERRGRERRGRDLRARQRDGADAAPGARGRRVDRGSRWRRDPAALSEGVSSQDFGPLSLAAFFCPGAGF